jgi:cellobiose phosphorylase
MSQPTSPARFPITLQSPAGLSLQVNANGSIRRMDHRDILLNLFLGDEMEGGLANVFLRKRGKTIEAIPLLGPKSPSRFRFSDGRLCAAGEWAGMRYGLELRLADSAPGWFWHVEIENTGDKSVYFDLVHAQDTALAHYGAVRMNEYYVSQYVDHTPLFHPERGWVLAVRQNLAMGGLQPWAVLGALDYGVGYATDALQFFGTAHRAGELPAALTRQNLPNRRHQHEHSMAIVQDRAVMLVPGATVRRGFFGWFEPDHPAASGETDLAFVERALKLPEAMLTPIADPGAPVLATAATLFSQPRPLETLDLDARDVAQLFDEDCREQEYDEGRLLSFFTGPHHHVVLKQKETRVLRPHGHMLRTGRHLTPDEGSLTSTLWMKGVFHSLVTQGHVSINRLLSTTRGYLNFTLSHGLRVFVETRDGFHLLELPSAFEMTLDGARWIYKHAGGVIAVSANAAAERHVLTLAIDVLEGAPCRFLISQRVALNGDDGADAVPVRYYRDETGIVLSAIRESDVGRRFPEGYFRFDPVCGTVIEQVGGDELLFADGQSRDQPFLVVVTAKAVSAKFRLTGHLIEALPAGAAASDEPVGLLLAQIRPSADPVSPLGADVGRLEEILPWYTHNALIHYLAPRGLEQFSGGGWGTRDICQGPVELLLGFGWWTPLRDLLVRVFKAQNPDGDWPQWFTFFERDRGIRAGDSHGDIVFWPLLALAQYLIASGDAALLDKELTFFHPDGDTAAERATVWGHVERALDVIQHRVIPKTALAAYGHGDWNDSLQPADPAMRELLCSAWTVTLHYQVLGTLGKALREAGLSERAEAVEKPMAAVYKDFQRYLIADAVLTGFAYFAKSRKPKLLVHPSDTETGMHYSVLAMIHGITNDLFTQEQAAAHVALIRAHLTGPDGIHLFDVPPRYQGGPQTYFQRAESSSFFGREIGIMYMHAHLRYAEAMAHYGDAEAFFLALCQANPIAVRAVVPNAAPRQANCYYSSSDAAFFDRYEASARYDEALAGTVPVEGGWRVYSSGAGIASRLIHRCLLGFEPRKSSLVIDPVIPKSLDKLEVDLVLCDRPVTVVYRIAERGHGLVELVLNGHTLDFEREPNPYRTGGVRVALTDVTGRLKEYDNRLVVSLG